MRSKRAMRPSLRLLLLAVLALAVAAPTSAQTIYGRVMDGASGTPLPRAVVSVIGADAAMLAAALSDSAGWFALPVPDSGGAWLRVEAYGYEAQESDLEAPAAGVSHRLDVRLRARPLEVAGVTATAKRRSDDHLAGFLRRREWRFGRFLGPAEIAEVDARSGDLLLASVPGVRRDYRWGNGIYLNRRSTFGAGWGGGGGGLGGCRPTVYLDGRILDEFGVMAIPGGASFSIDWYVPFRAIRAAEVYLEPRDAPARYHRGSRLTCGIILLWTEEGFGFVPEQTWALDFNR